MSIDMAQFYQGFFEESFEGLEVMEQGLMELVPGTPDPEAINGLFRVAHSIKGGSGTFGFKEIASFTHVMETLLDEMRDNIRDVTENNSDILLKSIDCLREMLEATQNGTPVDQDRVREYQQALELELNSGLSDAINNHKPVERVSGDRRVKDRRTTQSRAGSIRVDTFKIDSLINMVGELVVTQSMLGLLGKTIEDNHKITPQEIEKLSDGLMQLERHTRELQENVMQVRMMPISYTFSRFHRLVHDLSSQLGKKVELKMNGENTEVDKNIIEKIGDPLVHLLRNSLDHGIEMPDERIARGKPETGTIHLNAFHRGGNIVIEIADDGKGMDKEILRQKGIEKGLINDEDILSDKQIFDLIFTAGFSTASEVTDVSGRGVGMDVVRRNILELGGSAEIDSRLGLGSTITIRLPLTLAILDGQTIRVGEEHYIVPVTSIVESLQIKTEMVNMISGLGETLKLRDEYIPIIRLHNIFGLESKDTISQEGLLVVVESDGQQMGLLIDELLGQQQVVIKSLEQNYKRTEGFSGATILSDGRVVLILDMPGVMRLNKKKAQLSRVRAA